MKERKRILFVDDSPRFLDILRRVLRLTVAEWDLEFATSGQEALDLMERAPFDVVAADVRMPRMGGAEFLRKVRMRHPQSVRIAMADPADFEGAIGVTWSAHQYLAKPCDPDDLKATLKRALRIGRLLKTGRLRKVISRIESLPSLPSTYKQLVEEVASPHSSMTSIGEIISRDMGMTAKVLQLANSAFYRRGREVSDPAHAASMIGLDTIKALAISTHVFSQFDTRKLAEFSLEDLWNHSLTVAVFARWIAAAQCARQQKVDQAFVAGLLHDVGRLALASEQPGDFAEALRISVEEETELSEAEYRVHGAGHAETGAYLLGLWGLPDAVVEAVAFHHEPAESGAEGFSPLVAVHVANVLAHEFYSWFIGPKTAALDESYLASQGLLGRMFTWRNTCQSAIRENWGCA